MKDKTHVLRENFFMLGQIWRFSPGLVLSKLICTVLTAGQSALIVVGNAEILRMLERGEQFAAFLPLLALLGGSILIAHLTSRVCALYLFPKYTNQLQCGLTESLFQKAIECDLADFDDPVFFSALDQAVRQTLQKAHGPLETLTRILRIAVTFGSGCALIFSVSPILFLIAFLGSVGSFFIHRKTVKIHAEQDLAVTPCRRKANYARRVFFLAEYASELRTAPGIADLLLRDFEDAEREGLAVSLRPVGKLFRLSLLSRAIETAGSVFSTLAVAAGYFRGSVGLADFWVAAINLGAVQNLLSTFGDLWNQFTENALYITRYRTFLKRQPKVQSGPLPPSEDFRTLEFRDVSFRYGEDETAPYRLRHLHLTIRRGEKIALVGENGAGKTTFVKLLLRLYDPTEGEILLDGINIKNFDLPAYRRRMGAAFQDFRLFPATVAENVLGGAAREKDRALVWDALRAAGLAEKIEILPEGIESQVTKEFDPHGVQFSGGEGQKLALARAFAAAFARKAPVTDASSLLDASLPSSTSPVSGASSPSDTSTDLSRTLTVLDEPSSALDPLAEAALNRAVTETLREGTLLFISHRLSTVRDADRICLFADGRIAEEGSHDALMEGDGEYAALFRLQGARYVD